MIAFFAPPSLDGGMGSGIGENRIGIQPIGKFELQVGVYRQTGAFLSVRTVIQFIQDVVIVECVVIILFFVIEIFPVFIESRDCPAAFVGIVHRSDFILIIVSGGNISVESQ